MEETNSKHEEIKEVVEGNIAPALHITQLHEAQQVSVKESEVQKRKTYPQDWKIYNHVQEHEETLFMDTLSDLLKGIPEQQYTFGRPRLSNRDMLFMSALKVFETKPCKRFMDNASIEYAFSKGYIGKRCNSSTISDYMDNPAMTELLNELIIKTGKFVEGIDGSHSIDSTGISPSKYSPWFSKKYGEIKPRKLFYKLHLIVGNQTKMVIGFKITDEFVSDMNTLSDMVTEALKNFKIKVLCADKGYISDNNLIFLQRLGITAYIPFKENTIPNNEEKSAVWQESHKFFVEHQEEFNKAYHQRSKIESVFSSIKAKYGDSVRSKNHTSCINEQLLMILCYQITRLNLLKATLNITPDY